MFSISVDWSNYYESGWENVGRSIARENCTHFDDDGSCNNMDYSGYCEKCGFYEDSCEPMMSFAYPLETEPENDAILEVCQKTNCTVMYNTEEDRHYLALCGGGMDLSQDIAFAYLICEKWIPFDLATQVCTQPDLSISGKNFRKVMRAVRSSLKNHTYHAKRQIKNINESIKESLQKARR